MSSGKITDARIAELKETIENRDKVKEKLEEDLKELEDEKKALDELKDQLESFEDDAMSSAAYMAKHNRNKGEERSRSRTRLMRRKPLSSGGSPSMLKERRSLRGSKNWCQSWRNNWPAHSTRTPTTRLWNGFALFSQSPLFPVPFLPLASLPCSTFRIL